MWLRAVSVLSTAFILAWASAAVGQVIPTSVSGPSRFSFGGDGVISQPKGEFAWVFGGGFQIAIPRSTGY